jgi:hypothetical protein
MGEEGPAVTLRPVYTNAMTSTEDLATGGARYQDAATQTLPGPDLLTNTVRADLLSQGFDRATEQLLKIYSKVHLDEVLSRSAEAEQLAIKAKVLLDAAKELMASSE